MQLGTLGVVHRSRCAGSQIHELGRIPGAVTGTLGEADGSNQVNVAVGSAQAVQEDGGHSAGHNLVALGRRVFLLDVDGHTHLSQLRGHSLRHVGGVQQAAGNGQVHSKAIGITGLGQQALRLLGVVGVALHTGVVIVVFRSGDGGYLHGIAVQHTGDQAVAVNGVVQGLTNLQVVDGAVAVDGVELQPDHTGGGLAHHGNAVHAAQVIGLGGGDAADDVHLTGLQGSHAVRRLGNNLVDQLIDLRNLTVVIGVLLHHDLVVLGPGDELEGAGTHRILSELLVAHFLNVLAGDDLHVVQAQRQRVEGLIGHDVKLVIAQNFHAHEGEVTGQGVTGVLVLQALDGVLHIGAGHLVAVGEVHIVPQGEVPGHIVHTLVAGRGIAHDVAFGIGFNQRAVQVRQNTGGDGAGAPAGVQASNIGCIGVSDRLGGVASGRLRRSGSRRAGGRSAACEQAHRQRQAQRHG